MNDRPIERTPIGAVLSTVSAGRKTVELRQLAIGLIIEQRSRDTVTPEVIRQLGGRKHSRISSAKTEAQAELDMAEARAERWLWLKRLPCGARWHERAFGRRAATARVEAEKAAAVLASLEARIARMVSRKARQSVISEYREESEALCRAIDRIDFILTRLEALAAEGVSHLAIEPSARAGSGWYRRLSEMVAPRPVLSGFAASPIADGKDHSDKNLSYRSRVIPVPYHGKPAASRPWLNMMPDRRPFLAEGNRLPGGLAGFRLLGADLPPQLYAPRCRSGIPKLPGAYVRDDRVYLPIGLDDVGPATAAGATMTARKAFHIDPSKVSIDGAISPWLPFIASRWFSPLPVELIPKTSFGASLANLLTQASWNEIRHRVTVPYDGKCQVCGELRNGQSIECHEIWQYGENDRYGDMSVQRLVGIYSVCKPCHGVFHQGFSRMRGHGDQAAYRLADINGWSMEEFEAAEARMAADYARRSKLKWALDLSLVASGKPLTVNKGAWIEGEYGILRSGANSNFTAILGAAYRLGARGDVIEPVRPPKAA